MNKILKGEEIKSMSQQLAARSTMSESHRLRAGILAHLARYGASRVSTLSEELGATRAQVQYQLSRLEAEALVKSDRPAAERRRFTPFYGLASSRSELSGQRR